MKRWVIISLILPFILLISLYLWRKNGDVLKYDINGFTIPLSNNYIIISDSNQKIALMDASRYQNHFNSNTWNNYDLITYLKGSIVSNRTVILKGDLFFTLRKSQVYVIDKSNHKYLILNLSKRKVTEKGNLINKIEFFKEYKLKESEFLSYKDWFKIWYRNGRLPWFPEHVGK